MTWRLQSEVENQPSLRSFRETNVEIKGCLFHIYSLNWSDK